MILKVRHAMKDQPTTIDAEATVTETAHKMIQTGKDTLIVLEKNSIKGTIDLRNVLYYTYAEGFRPNQTPVGEITNVDIIFARPNTSLEDALTIMIETNHNTLPVVDGDLVGTISIHDLLKVQPKIRPLKAKNYMP